MHPIVLTEDLRLVAGLHRLRACEQLGWKTISATVLPLSKVEANLASLDENLARHELTVLERGEMLAQRKRLYEALHPESRRGVAGARARAGSASEIISFAAEVSRKTHLSPRTVQHEVQIAQAIPKDVRKMIRGSRLEDHKVELLRLARLPHDEQREVARRVLSGESTTVKRAEAALVQERIESNREPYPKGKFGVLVVDPPWTVTDLMQGYPGMTVDEIKKVPVPQLATDDAMVLLWIPPSMLREGLDVLDAWGLRQVGYVAWEKHSPRPGTYVLSRVELCLLAVRGRPLVLSPQSNLISASRRQHSRKPDEFYTLVEKSFGGRRLDMFARESRPGWTTWGPERTKFDGEVARPSRDARHP